MLNVNKSNLFRKVIIAVFIAVNIVLWAIHVGEYAPVLLFYVKFFNLVTSECFMFGEIGIKGEIGTKIISFAFYLFEIAVLWFLFSNEKAKKIFSTVAFEIMCSADIIFCFKDKVDDGTVEIVLDLIFMLFLLYDTVKLLKEASQNDCNICEFDEALKSE